MKFLMLLVSIGCSVSPVCHGEDTYIYSFSDRIVSDINGDDSADSIYTEEFGFDAVGDTGTDAELRTVLTFDLSSNADLITNATSILLNIRVDTTVGTAPDWKLVHLTGTSGGSVVVSDYQVPGVQVGSVQSGTLASGSWVQFDVTDIVKGDSLAGGWSGFRLEVDTPSLFSDGDGTADQIRFFTQEGEIGSAPYLYITPEAHPRIALWANLLKDSCQDQELLELYRNGARDIHMDVLTLGSAGIVADAKGWSFDGLDMNLAAYSQMGCRSLIMAKPRSEALWTEYPPLDETGSVGDTHNDLVCRYDIFNPIVCDDFFNWTTNIAAHYEDDPSVYGYWLFGAIGNTEWAYPYVVSNAPMVHSSPAEDSFRAYLQDVYSNDLAVLNQKWQTSFSSWAGVEPPLKLQTFQLDDRPEWLDFVGWYHDSFMAFTEEAFSKIDNVTDKPFGILFGGSPVGYGPLQSMSLMGPLMKMMSNRGGMFCKSSAANYYLGQYTASARRFYAEQDGYVEIFGENPGLSEHPELIGTEDEELEFGQTASEVLVQYFMNMLSFGFDTSHYNSVEVLFETNGLPTAAYELFAQGADVLRQVNPTGKSKPVGMLHSYMTSFFRTPYQNQDAINVYDTGLNMWPRTHEFHWARFMYQPDVVDEVMLEDGVLDGLSVLVTPNSSFSVVSDAAYSNLSDWVTSGGVLVSFGPKSMKYLYNEDDASIETASYPLAGMLPAQVSWQSSTGGSYQVCAGYEDVIPDSLDSGVLLQDKVIDPASLSSGSEVLVENECGDVLVAVIPAVAGTGKVVVFSQPLKFSGDGVEFCAEVAPRLIRKYIQSLPLDLDIEVDDPEAAVVQSAGTDMNSGKEVFTLTIADKGHSGALQLDFSDTSAKILAVTHQDVYDCRISISDATLVSDGYIQLWEIPVGLSSVEVLYEQAVVNCSSDRIVADSNGDDLADSLYAEEFGFNAVGDTGVEAELRTVLKFDLSLQKLFINAATNITLNLKVETTMGSPGEWTLVHIVDGNNGVMAMGDYQSTGTQVGATCSGTLTAGQLLQFDVTSEVKTDVLSGNWSAFRLQAANPASIPDNNGIADHIRFYTQEDGDEGAPCLRLSD